MLCFKKAAKNPIKIHILACAKYALFDHSLHIATMQKMKTQKPISKINQYIIDQVKVKRLVKRYSQKKLAYLLGVSSGFIGNVENPNYRAKYTMKHINELAIIFECSPRDFLPEQAL